MHRRVLVAVFLASGMVSVARAQEPIWWEAHIEEALVQAKGNRAEIEKALQHSPKEQRPGIAFLVVNMPAKDLTSLTADFLLKNLALAYEARARMPWGKTPPEELFLNDVLPYASITET